MAIRRRVWYRAVGRVERPLVGAVVAGFDRVRSPALGGVLKDHRQDQGGGKGVQGESEEARAPHRQEDGPFGRRVGHRGAIEWAQDPAYAEWIGMCPSS